MGADVHGRVRDEKRGPKSVSTRAAWNSIQVARGYFRQLLDLMSTIIVRDSSFSTLVVRVFHWVRLDPAV
jgi:hypothetical protein